MKTIYLHHPYDVNNIMKEPIVLALGFFDGVHRGHQKVIQEAKKIANRKGMKMALMTFTRHPSILYKKYDDIQLKYLTDSQRKNDLMEYFGVDILYKVDFTSSFASLSPQKFVDQYVIGLHASVAVAGFDYTYGEKEIANMPNLPFFSKDKFDILTVNPFVYNQKKISSTCIRLAIANGEILKANRMLGYAYCTTGFVVRGDARGRELGFPTANVQIKDSVCLPSKGIYAVKVRLGKELYNGMASIGYNVTFQKRNTLSIEVNIFDFKKEIYGETISIYWISYLRDEVKYTGPDPLIQQLHEDETASRRILLNDKTLII